MEHPAGVDQNREQALPALPSVLLVGDVAAAFPGLRETRLGAFFSS